VLDVILYTKEGCGLCDDVRREMMQLRESHPHRLTEIDITLDRELFAKYRYAIPVLKIGERILKAPITSQGLREFLVAPL
jgi:hypothetical protein